MRNFESARTEVEGGTVLLEQVREVMEELVVEKDGFELNREPVGVGVGVVCSLQWW